MNRQNLINNSWLRFILVVLSIGTLSFFLVGVMKKKPILIGFSAELTGRQAELGVQERNGVQLAVETINASGGVAGRKIELIVRDDFGIPEKAQAADCEVIKAGVLAIIGHATSGQTVAGLEVNDGEWKRFSFPPAVVPAFDTLAPVPSSTCLGVDSNCRGGLFRGTES